MAVIEHSSYSVASGVARPAFVTRAVQMAASWYRLRKNRGAVRQLRELSDWELADIGLLRSDLHDALLGAPLIDPTLRLGRIVKSRCSGEDAARRVY